MFQVVPFGLGFGLARARRDFHDAPIDVTRGTCRDPRYRLPAARVMHCAAPVEKTRQTVAFETRSRSTNHSTQAAHAVPSAKGFSPSVQGFAPRLLAVHVRVFVALRVASGSRRRPGGPYRRVRVRCPRAPACQHRARHVRAAIRRLIRFVRQRRVRCIVARLLRVVLASPVRVSRSGTLSRRCVRLLHDRLLSERSLACSR